MRTIHPCHLPSQTLKRLPVYLQHLKSLCAEETPYVSATTLAKALELNDVQVRKDLALVSDIGKPKVGYEIHRLIYDLEQVLGFSNCDDAILVGAGRLGQALLGYKGFEAYGLNIVAAFDTDPALHGAVFSGKPVYPVERLESLCQRLSIEIGILTAPAESAQEVCDRMCAGGIRAIWNFAPAHLRVSEGILVQNENMAASLALLSNHLKQNHAR